MTNSLIENWTNYSMRLRKTPNPDFSKIRNLSSEFITKLPQEAQDELFSQMNRGELPLGSEPEMSMYMFAYGKMHYEKLLRAFEQIPKTFFQNEIEIIDYGCGQAMGLIAYADYIKQRGYNQKITNITLIEPSKLTIGRAILHANQIFPNVTVNAICKSLDDLDDADIQTDANIQKLHLFSNIIDIELFSLDQLTEYIKQRFDGNNQFVCVSPFFGSSSSRANRLDEFMNLVATSSFYSENLGKNDWINGWTCSIRVFANNAQNANAETDSDTVTDIDGNVYKTVKIGNQIWMAENLRVSRYRNGDFIPNKTDYKEWRMSTIGSWCNYNNDTANDLIYGKLYNWDAVEDNRNIAPKGWHIPSNEEWNLLIYFCGGADFAGGKLKEVDTIHWAYPNEGATNESGFFAIPCGCRDGVGNFTQLRTSGNWWSSTEKCLTSAWNSQIGYKDSSMNTYGMSKPLGLAVRCVKDSEPDTVTDIDGNAYKTVQIGNQIWMAENLRVSRYRNGDLIPNISCDNEWEELESGGWCNYENNPVYDSIYGKLYNWFSVDDTRNIAPTGWHVPSDEEWNILIEFLGGNSVAVVKLKEAGTSHWRSPNEGATNESGFSALPIGFRSKNSLFNMQMDVSIWWCKNQVNSTHALIRDLTSFNSYVGRSEYAKVCGFNIRCVKDSEPDSVTDIDGNVYKTTQIGSQVWMTENLKVSRYRNGDLIPNITNDNEWKNSEIGAWCNFENKPENDSLYSKLYNWFSVNDSRNIAPQGWHVPSDEDWNILIDFCGGEYFAGKKFRKSATNDGELSDLLGGCRDGEKFRTTGGWWSATQDNAKRAWTRYIFYLGQGSLIRRIENKVNGYSVRCLKDSEPDTKADILDEEYEDYHSYSPSYSRAELNEMTRDIAYEGDQDAYEGSEF